MVTVPPNPFALFVFYQEWANLEAHNFKTITNFKKDIKAIKFSLSRTYLKTKQIVQNFWLERPFKLLLNFDDSELIILLSIRITNFSLSHNALKHSWAALARGTSSLWANHGWYPQNFPYL